MTAERGIRAVEFDDYVAAHRRALLRFAGVLAADPSAADDVVAEVLARAFASWEQVSSADNVHASTSDGWC